MKHAAPLENLNVHVVHLLTNLLESVVRAQAFDYGEFSLLIRQMQHLAQQLHALAGRDADMSPLAELAARCDCMSRNLQLLHEKRQRDSSRNAQAIQTLILDFHALIQKLALTLIDRDLFERQSNVLQNIILSHDKAAQWKAFVQEILSEFHQFFPFHFFTIACTDENGIHLYLYYLGDYDETARRAIRQQLTQNMIRELHVAADRLIDIEEFQVLSEPHTLNIERIETLTLAVPSDSPGVGGILGVSYAYGLPLSAQEQSIVRSLLSVMVMVVGSSRTLSRSLMELEYYAKHDPLTGLHNRRYFNDILEYEINRAARHRYAFSLLTIDLDNFKGINDRYGHMAGDLVLQHLGQLLRQHLRQGDALARIGGDEFAVLLPATDPPGALHVAEHLRQTVHDHAFVLAEDQEVVHISISVGLVSYPRDAHTLADLISGADLALYHAKAAGKDYVCALEAVEQLIAQQRHSHDLSQALRKALQAQRIVPFFQPIFDVARGEIYAYEALARLKTEQGDIIAAGQFIEAADKHGISLNLDHVMLRHVTAAMAEHATRTGHMPRVFVNLTPQEIQRRDILQYAESLCREQGIDPSRLVFEITEREAISDLTNMRKFLLRLREKGFAFALDDFGSGYNSFHYLRELHFEYVKIDGAFINNLLQSKIDHALVETLNQLCHRLDMLTIAEFVESQAVMDELRRLGINFAQGYHLGLPCGHFLEG